MSALLAAVTFALALAAQLGLGAQPWAPYAWLAAVLLFLPQARSRPLPAAEPSMAWRSEAAALAAVLAVGVFYRVWRLDLIPSGLNHDVAWNGLYALRILAGEPYTPYTAEAWGRETTMLYLQALGILLFGVEVPALVYPAVLAGILLLPLLYLWARELFGARLALAATFLLAVSGWHVVFSRVGWRAVLQPLVSTLAYWLFARGWRRRDTLSFCGAGAAAAAALYTYNAARLLPVLFPAFGLWLLWRAPDRRAALARWRPRAVDMAGTFALVAAPMAWYAFTHWATFQQRASATFAADGRPFWRDLAHLVEVYVLAARGDDFFIDTPVLEWPVGPLFIFGALWCALRARADARAAFLVLGWLVAALPAFLSSPNANRMIGTLPFAYVFAALGAAFALQALTRAAALAEAFRSHGLVARALCAGLVLATAGATWAQYFGPNRRELHGFYPEATIVGRYARTLLPDYEVSIGGANYPRDTLDYLTHRGGDPRQRGYRWLDDVSDAATSAPAAAEGKGVAFILANEGRSALAFEQLRRRFPGARVVELESPTRPAGAFARALLLEPADLGAAAPAAAPAPLPRVGLAQATRGSEPGQLLEPRGVALGGDGSVYVADSGNHRIQVFAPDGRLVAVLGERGATPGTFDEPSDVALDQDGTILVADTWNHRVQRLRADGFPLSIYESPQGLFGPRGLDVRRGWLYVADTGGHSVALFDADGLFVGTIGLGEGEGPGELRSPVDVAVTDDDRIWVVDSGNHRLQVFAASGEVLQTLPVPGWSGELLREGYLAADGRGVLLTDPNAGVVWSVAADGRFSPVARGLRFPGGVATGGAEAVVSERDAGRVTRLAR